MICTILDFLRSNELIFGNFIYVDDFPSRLNVVFYDGCATIFGADNIIGANQIICQAPSTAFNRLSQAPD